MNIDDLRDFEDQYPHVPTSSMAYVHIVYDITPYIIPEVNHDMLRRLQASINSGDIQIINMNVEGDGSTNKCVSPIIYRYHIQISYPI